MIVYEITIVAPTGNLAFKAQGENIRELLRTLKVDECIPLDARLMVIWPQEDPVEPEKQHVRD